LFNATKIQKRNEITSEIKDERMGIIQEKDFKVFRMGWR
jgi:hypothetical protein